MGASQSGPCLFSVIPIRSFCDSIPFEEESQRIKNIACSVEQHLLDQGLVIIAGPPCTGKSLITDRIDGAHMDSGIGYGEPWPEMSFDSIPNRTLIVDDAKWMGRNNLFRFFRTITVRGISAVVVVETMSDEMKSWLIDIRATHNRYTAWVQVHKID